MICAFRSTAFRNQIYSEGLSLRDQLADVKKCLYLSENLIKPDAENFTRLLAPKREGRIDTAFTRGGIPAFKLQESGPTRVFSREQLDRIIESLPRGARGADGACPPGRRPGERTSLPPPPDGAGRGGAGGEGGRRRRVG